MHTPGGILRRAAFYFFPGVDGYRSGLFGLFLSAYSLLILLCAAPWLLEHIRQSVRSSIPFNQAVSRPEMQ